MIEKETSGSIASREIFIDVNPAFLKSLALLANKDPLDVIFISEIPMYIHCEEVMEITHNAISASHSIEDNLYKTYEALERKNIVEARELDVLSAWLRDMTEISATVGAMKEEGVR